MKRRPWLALVVLVLLGISATMFVRSARAARFDDEHMLALGFDDSAGPCEAPVPVTATDPPHTLALVAEVPLAIVVTHTASVITIAPKTSPPR